MNRKEGYYANKREDSTGEHLIVAKWDNEYEWSICGRSDNYEDQYFSYISPEPIQMEQESKISRVEVIGNGREYVNMNTGNVTVQYQDDGRTLKVFVQKGIGAKQSEQPKDLPSVDVASIINKYFGESFFENNCITGQDIYRCMVDYLHQHTLTPITDAEISIKAYVSAMDEIFEKRLSLLKRDEYRNGYFEGYKQSITDRGGFTEGEVKAICDKYIDYLFHSEQIPNYADGTDSEMWTKWLTDYLTSKKQSK